MSCDRLDRGVVILGLHDDVEELVAPFERTHERVGDLPARDPGVILGHDASVTIEPPRRREDQSSRTVANVPTCVKPMRS